MVAADEIIQPRHAPLKPPSDSPARFLRKHGQSPVNVVPDGLAVVVLENVENTAMRSLPSFGVSFGREESQVRNLSI